MSLAAPWGLLGLLALPLVWWLHRRLSRPPELPLPSLMFLQDEADAHSLPRGRRLDAELLLALAAGALLALAAAGPLLTRRPAGRVVRVVVDTALARPGAHAYMGRLAQAREMLAAALAPEDQLRVVALPDEEPDPSRGRAAAASLLAAARAGDASARFVISDVEPPRALGDVAWVALGDPGLENQAVVAVDVREAGAGLTVFVTVVNHAPAARDVVVQAGWIERDGPREVRAPALSLAAEGRASTTLALPAQPVRLTVRLVAPGGASRADALAQDDGAVLERAPLEVRLDGLPPAHVARVRAALEAVVGEAGLVLLDAQHAQRRAHLGFRRHDPAAPPSGIDTSAQLLVELEPVPEGAPAEHAPAGEDDRGGDPLVRDLSAAGVDWVYGPGARPAAEGERVLLARGAWPVLLRGGNVVRLAPDPLRGEPCPADTPFWPLLVENLVRQVQGPGVGAGYRAVSGLLDDAASRPGRARRPLDTALLAAAPPMRAAVTRDLRPLSCASALACLLLLWAAPRLRHRLAGRRARRLLARA